VPVGVLAPAPGATKIPNWSVTTHESVGGLLSLWQVESQSTKPVVQLSPHDPVGHVALPLPPAGPGHTVQLTPQ
jgi:hypothetical protein